MQIALILLYTTLNYSDQQLAITGTVDLTQIRRETAIIMCRIN